MNFAHPLALLLLLLLIPVALLYWLRVRVPEPDRRHGPVLAEGPGRGEGPLALATLAVEGLGWRCR